MAVYKHLSDIPSSTRDALEGTLRPDETFVMAIHEDGPLSTLFPYFIVTDRRLIRFRKIWIWEYLSDIHFERLSRAEYETGSAGITGEVRIEGNDIHESFSFKRENGRRLADAIRDQLARKPDPVT